MDHRPVRYLLKVLLAVPWQHMSIPRGFRRKYCAIRLTAMVSWYGVVIPISSCLAKDYTVYEICHRGSRQALWLDKKGSPKCRGRCKSRRVDFNRNYFQDLQFRV
jgi:hypothetical protein